MNYQFRCTCNKLLIDQPLPIPKDIKCVKCAKTYLFYENGYREYELGVIVENEFTEKLDRLELNGLGLTNKIKRGLIRCREEKSLRKITQELKRN